MPRQPLYRTHISVTDPKYPNSYTAVDILEPSITTELPPPGESITETSLYHVFARVLRYNRLYLYRFALELLGTGWTTSRWRGRITFIIQQYPSTHIYGPHFSDLVLDADTPRTLEWLVVSDPADRGDYSFRLYFQASCDSREGLGPFTVKARAMGEVWEATGHEV